MTEASPDALVVAGEIVIAAEAPEAGAANVTIAPETGFPLASLTIATRGAPKAVPTVVLWLFPLLTAIVAGAPAVFVRLNVPDVAPEVEAVTV